MTRSTADRARGRTFRSLRVRNYRLFFFGQIVSVPGTWMQTVGLAWLVLKRSDDSSLAVGIVTALQFTPTLLLAAVGGVIADRFDKRRVLMLTQSWLALAAGSLGLLVLSGRDRLWMIYLLAMISGFGNVVDNPTRQSFASELVGREELVNAVGLNSMVFNSARVLGPALAAGVINVVGIGWCFVLNAVSFVAAIVALARMRPSELHRPPRVERARRLVRDGVLYAWRVPELRDNLAVMAVYATLAYNYPVVLPVLAKTTFDGDASTFALLTAAMGIGAVLGGFSQARRVDLTYRALRHALWGATAVCTLATLAPSVALIVPCFLVLGYFNTIAFTTSNTLLQIRAAPEMRGRVVALRTLTVIGGTPIGGPIVGALMQHFGARSGLVLTAATGLFCALWFGVLLTRRDALGAALSTALSAAPGAAVSSATAPATRPAPDGAA